MKVSVIVLSYNSRWEKLRATIFSILRQDYSDYELIVADDGSNKTYDDDIKLLVEKWNINLKFSNLTINQGTVKNVSAALDIANGKFVKLISAGDFLYDIDTLKNWVHYAENTNADICFGDAVYYSNINGVRFYEVNSSPCNIYIYNDRTNRKELFVDYLLANDTILGAAIIAKTKVFNKYIKRMVDKVKFAEDYAVRLMIFDNRIIKYFPRSVMWYEYGEGVSTSTSNKWINLLHLDFETSNEIIINDSKATDSISYRYITYLKVKKRIVKLGKLIKIIFFPTVIYFRRKMRSGRKTSIICDESILNKILEY